MNKMPHALLSSLHLSLVRNEFDGNHNLIHRTWILRTRVQQQLLVVLGGVWWSIRHAGWAPLQSPSIGSNKIYGRSVGRPVDGLSLSTPPWLPKFPPFLSPHFEITLWSYIHRLQLDYFVRGIIGSLDDSFSHHNLFYFTLQIGTHRHSRFSLGQSIVTKPPLTLWFP